VGFIFLNKRDCPFSIIGIQDAELSPFQTDLCCKFPKMGYDICVKLQTSGGWHEYPDSH
jgi:hypothetical protein